jgi:transglutaminase-like putative cysteine protease
MKKIFWLIIILILSLSAISESDNIYLKDSLKLQLNIEGEFDLIKESSSSSIKEVSTELLLFPQNSFRQTLLETDTTGEVKDNLVYFYWENPTIESKQYHFNSIVNTKNERLEVKEYISFPITDNLEEYSDYLQPTETIDSNNREIIQKASELVEGENDLFKAVFKLANWVEENVEYDLTTLTAETSQKASWVLENKQGVCDEMTSLFVAMSRSVGIPARFVSGISYTTSELFDNNWQPHGWAEVYFPNVGWVEFDITFGEYGYIDVTHIKLRNADDPAKASSEFSWLANKVQLNPGNLDFKVNLLEEGKQEKEMVQLEQEILSPSVNIGSYNLIKGILKNNAEYYAATTLKLAIPEEVEILGRNKRTILLNPKEVRETYWLVKVSEKLNQKYWYSFPSLIYNEKNVSIKNEFKSIYGQTHYSKEEIEELMIQDEDKTYSRKITFNCDYENEIKLGEESLVNCQIKNVGNTNLEDINYCVGSTCENINLPINQQYTIEFNVEEEKAGWQKIMVSAENHFIEKKTSVEYAVLDDPNINLNIEYPEIIKYGQELTINININKTSFNPPREVMVKITSPGKEQTWEIEQINKNENVKSLFLAKGIGFSNNIMITVTWKDQNDKSYSQKQELKIKGSADGFFNNTKLLINSIINWFL